MWPILASLIGQFQHWGYFYSGILFYRINTMVCWFFLPGNVKREKKSRRKKKLNKTWSLFAELSVRELTSFPFELWSFEPGLVPGKKIWHKPKKIIFFWCENFGENFPEKFPGPGPDATEAKKSCRRCIENLGELFASPGFYSEGSLRSWRWRRGRL